MDSIIVPSSIAEWKPFENKTKIILSPDILCYHTMVGTLKGSWDWANQLGNPYWHFGTDGYGAGIQCQDLRFRSAANLYGNWHVIAVETEDINNGVFKTPWDNPLWTKPQFDRNVAIGAYCCARFDIPPALIPDTMAHRRGIAYHRQGIDPYRVPGGELWSRAYGKACPARRIEQMDALVQAIREELYIPTNLPTTGDDMLMILRCAGKADRAVVGSKLVGFKPGPNRDNFIKAAKEAGIPVMIWDVTADQYESSSEDFEFSHAKVVG